MPIYFKPQKTFKFYCMPVKCCLEYGLWRWFFFPPTNLVFLHSVYINEPLNTRSNKESLSTSSNQSRKDVMSVRNLRLQWLPDACQGKCLTVRTQGVPNLKALRNSWGFCLNMKILRVNLGLIQIFVCSMWLIFPVLICGPHWYENIPVFLKLQARAVASKPLNTHKNANCQTTLEAHWIRHSVGRNSL